MKEHSIVYTYHSFVFAYFVFYRRLKKSRRDLKIWIWDSKIRVDGKELAELQIAPEEARQNLELLRSRIQKKKTYVKKSDKRGLSITCAIKFSDTSKNSSDLGRDLIKLMGRKVSAERRSEIVSVQRSARVRLVSNKYPLEKVWQIGCKSLVPEKSALVLLCEYYNSTADLFYDQIYIYGSMLVPLSSLHVYQISSKSVQMNKVLRKIFGAKRDEVTGEWSKLHNTELHALFLQSRRLRWAGHVARMSESRNAYRVLVGKPEEKGPLGRPRRSWEDNIKMDLREVGYDDRDWINLAQDRYQWRDYVRAATNLRVS
ncbi:hypothetical protein ANN_07909 [Periplaneta americana]|uniref:Uncharacterized protein n=1 Tax=Periplaneta americana TaxID=6978 RepID=A0ABQ8SZY0_PERAM|nr:hypothetical protein ANN_07909 [Periplaneta americana]